MRIDEIIREDQQEIMAFNKAWNIWVQGPGKMYNGGEQSAIKRIAQQEANRGIEPMDAISSAAGVIRGQRDLKQKSAPKSTPAPQKSAPEEPEEPEVKRSRGAQIGNQNAFKGGPTASPTTVVGKVLQKGKEKAQQWGGIKQGAQRRNRKLNNFS